MTQTLNLRERKKQQTRLDLVAAALQLFAERGYDATSIDDIAERAHVSRRTYFRHFMTKDDVAFGDGLFRLDEFRGELRSGAGSDDPVGLVCGLLREHVLEFSCEPVDRASVEMWFREPALRRRYTEIALSWEEAIVEYLAGERETDPAGDLGAQVVAASVCGVVKAALRVGREGPAAVAASLDAGFELVRQGSASTL